jgi:FG-GAP repeat
MELSALRVDVVHRAGVLLAVLLVAECVAISLCHSPRAQADVAVGPRTLDSASSSLSLRADPARTFENGVISQAGPLMAPYAMLTGPPEANSRFGSSIAFSRDGTTVAIGGESDHEGLGAVWIFRRSGDAWVQQGPKLVPADTGDVVNFGARVTISANGDTVLVGDGRKPAVAWVYVREGNAWRQQGAPLEPRPIRGEPAVSTRIALSADGATAVLTGVLEGRLARGAAWVFVRAGGHWVQQGKPLWSGSNAPEQGYSAALSAGGNTLLLGTAEAGYEGIARVFVRSRGRWHVDGRSLPGSGVVNGLGAGVALSADGRTALVGAPAAEAEQGLTIVYRRMRGGWRSIARLTAPGHEGSARFGDSVSLSADGEIAIVLALGTADGKAFVYARSGDRWVQRDTLSGVSGPLALAGDGDAILTAPSTDGPTYTAQLITRTHSTWTGQSAAFAPGELSGRDSTWFAQSVALSADGTTALVGDEGGAWVFVRTAAGWVQQGGKLEGVSQDHETSVALSADGNTAVIGEPTEKGGGAAWVFSRSGQAWSPGTPLVPSGVSPLSSAASASAESQGFGTSVAISGDGATVLVGDAADAGGIGAVWVFAGAGSSWTQQGPKLTADDELGSGELGASVALSGDGDTALIGGPQDNLQNQADGTAPPNSGSGAGWIFTRTGAAWSQTAKLVEQGEAHEAQLGFAVGLSAGGETALVGGAGEVASYALSGAAWAQQGPPLTPGTEGDDDAFGTRLALSADGLTAIVAGTPETGCGKYMLDSCSRTGTVWDFSRSGLNWRRKPGPLTHPIPFGSSLALAGDGQTALIEGSTPGAEPGGAAFVSQVAP